MPAKKKIPVRHTKAPARGKTPEWSEEPPVVVVVEDDAPVAEPEPEPAPVPAKAAPAPMGLTGVTYPIPAVESGNSIGALLQKQERAELEALYKRLEGGDVLTAAQRKRIAKAEEEKLNPPAPPPSMPPAPEPAKIAENLDAWWVNGDGGKFYVQEHGHWLNVQREMLCLRMSEIGVRDFRFPGEAMSPQAATMLHIERKRVLHRCLEGLAGYKSGVTMIKNRNILLMSGANFIKPLKGEWKTIAEFLDGILLYDNALDVRNANIQVMYFEAWMQRAVENLYLAGDVTLNGQLLALAGEQGSGKSRIQHFLITPLLGGRAADPQPYLFGDTDFNDEWMESEHLCTEDPRPSAKLHDRVQFAQKLKGLIVNDNHRWRGLYRGALTVSPKFRVSMSFNDDPDAIRFFPPLTPDFRDKVIVLKAFKRPLPMPTGTPEERRAFREQITRELPAYLHYLLYELIVPAAMKNERFGVKEYADPDIRSLLWDDSPAAELLEFIDETELTVDRGAGQENRRSIFYTECGCTPGEAIEKYGFKIAGTDPRRLVDLANHAGKRLWIGRFAQLQEQLEAETSNRQKQVKKLTHHNSVPRMLGRLAQDQPDRIALHPTKAGRLWVIVEKEPSEDDTAVTL